MNWGNAAKWVVILALVAAGLWIVLIPVCSYDRWDAMQSACRFKHKASTIALTLYTEDNNDWLPEAKWWMGAVSPYAKSLQEDFSCPWVHHSKDKHDLRYTVVPDNPETDLYSGVFGHAMTSLHRRIYETPDKETTVLTFDSTDPTWNSFGPVDTPRYRDFKGKRGLMVSFMSGRTKFVPESEWEKLK